MLFLHLLRPSLKPGSREAREKDATSRPHAIATGPFPRPPVAADCAAVSVNAVLLSLLRDVVGRDDSRLYVIARCALLPLSLAV